MRSVRNVFFLVLFVMSTAPATAENSSPMPRVVVLTTGGTIASTGKAGLTGEKLLATVPGLEKIARIEVENLANVGSSSLTRADWARITAAVRRTFAAPDVAGVVITHGTDTLEETAFFLDLVIDDERPVVITGAMRGAATVSADGPANLVQAIRVASDPHARGLGTVVALDNEVHLAVAVTKSDTNRLSAFVSPNGGPVGIVTDEGLRLHSRPAHVHPHYPLTATRIEQLPRVEIVPVQFDADNLLFRAAIEGGARAVVLAGFGSGTLTPGIGKAALDAARKGIPVVLASRVAAGWVKSEFGPALVRSGRLSPAKARILTMVVLASGQAGDINQTLFDRF